MLEECVSPLAHGHVLLFEVAQEVICHPADHLPRLLLGPFQHFLKVFHKSSLALQHASTSVFRESKNSIS